VEVEEDELRPGTVDRVELHATVDPSR
jgi:hypothetical protein